MRKAIYIARTIVGCFTATALVAATPALADDDTKVALAAGLGLSAASGKTTLGNGAGAIEAGVLGVDAYDRAGSAIASLVNQHASDKTVLVLAHDETVSLAMAEVVKKRIDTVIPLLLSARKPCTDPPAKADQKGGKVESFIATPKGPANFYASDIVAAVATDTTINAITLTAEDRLLINAVLMNRASSATGAHFRLAGEATLAGVKSQLASKYAALLEAEDTLRTHGCTSAAAKAAFSTTDELVKSLNTPADKTGITPLIAAMQADAFASKSPLILRLAIEQTGGTAITRSGVLYTVGFPNAATVSSGLVVSFRLLDPANGELKLVGIVRCAVPPQNLKKVASLVQNGGKETVCSVRSG